MRFRFFRVWILAAAAGVLVFSPMAVSAQESESDSIFGGITQGIGQTASEAGYDVQEGDPESTLGATINRVVNLAIGMLGVVATLFIIYAGYLWMTAGGDTNQIEHAKHILKQVVVGFIVLSLAYALVTFVFSLISRAGGSDQAPQADQGASGTD